MKLRFLGTGAADWCLAISEGKPVTRRYSSVIIDDKLVIDPGPGVLDALKVNKIEFSSVKYVLNTHDHDDHMNRDNLKVLTNCGAKFINTEKPGVYKFGKYTVEAVKANHAIACVHFIISDGSLFFSTVLTVRGLPTKNMKQYKDKRLTLVFLTLQSVLLMVIFVFLSTTILIWLLK